MGGLSAAAPPAAADACRSVPRDWLLTPSLPWRLGAHCVDGGVHFAVFSAHASRVDLCVFDEHGHTELARLPLPGHEHDIWHGHLAGAGPGLVYGFRAHGPWRPERGHRFNPHKLLLDPWAREIVGHFNWGGEHVGADPRHPSHQDQRDNAATALKARVVGRFIRLAGRSPPAPCLRRYGDLRTAPSRASASSMPACRPSCAAPMPAWPMKPAWRT